MSAVQRRSASPLGSNGAPSRSRHTADAARSSPSPPQRSSLYQPEASTSSARPATRSSPPSGSMPHPNPQSRSYASIPQTTGPVAGPSTVSVGHGRPSAAAALAPSSPVSARPSAAVSSSPVLGVRTASVNAGPVAGSSSAGSTSGHTCAKCGLPMTGQFVRALGLVFHLNCFTCEDCNKVVAAKFFPVDGPDGRQYPLCETDYFRRLRLLCAKCGCALRGSYITALDKKYHTEHFTCSVCPTVFGPQDSYYEHAGDVYCHFHYSCRFAVKCTGCRVAILKQFVEINRNNTDEHWHPECYMIHKPSFDPTTVDPSNPPQPAPPDPLDDWKLQESAETPSSLRGKQRAMEDRVYRIWTVLSTFEESSAACISEMLRHVSNGHYVEGVRMAEKFVVHVETLFAAIDDLSALFRRSRAKDFSHVREARMLCKKIVSFFSLLSQSQEMSSRKMGITQELLSLVTGLAHYLKMLIRIALTAALKLEREHADVSAIQQFLGRLDRLARDPNAAKPASDSPDPAAQNGVGPRTYGYRSLAHAVGTLVGQGEATTDLCEGCHGTIEEECARFGTSARWHLGCLRCGQCGRVASKEPGDAPRSTSPGADGSGPAPCHLGHFRLDRREGTRGGATFCPTCAPSSTVEGFEFVTRLEQYAFLLAVALNKLYALLKTRGIVPSDSTTSDGLSAHDEPALYESYRDSNEVKRMKAVNLDRKLSATAQLPRRSVVIESPSGNAAQVAVERPSETMSRQSSAGNIVRPPAMERVDSQPIAPVRPPITTRESAPVVMIPPLRPDPDDPRSAGGSSTPVRPHMTRAITSVRIVDEGSPQRMEGSPVSPEPPPIDDGNITLADLQGVMEAEQARAEHRPRPAQRQGALLSELSALEYLIVKYVAALTLGADDSPFRDLAPTDELLELIDDRKGGPGSFWGKIFKGGNDKKAVKKKGVFNVPLEFLVDRSGADSMLGSGATPVRIPNFIDDLISAMRQMDMSVEGVFRKNGNIRRLKDLCDALDRDSSNISLVDENPVQLAALLKKFLRELPDPLLTFKLHYLFVATQRVEPPEERARVLHLVCCLLPKAHRDTMEVIFVFLKWVASFSHVDEETGSKMDLPNLATVICPNILYAKGKDPTKDESFLAIRAIAELLEHQDWFWQVPEDMAAILEDADLLNNVDSLSSKDILSRCREYVGRRRSPSDAGALHPPPRHGPAHRGEVVRGEGRVYDGDDSFAGSRPLSWHANHQSLPPPPSMAQRNGRPLTPESSRHAQLSPAESYPR